MDPLYQSSMALKALDRDWLEEGDDEQSELDARLVAEDICWERMKQENGI